MNGQQQREPHAFPGPFNQVKKDEKMPWLVVLIVIVAYIAISLTILAFRQAAAERKIGTPVTISRSQNIQITDETHLCFSEVGLFCCQIQPKGKLKYTGGETVSSIG